MMTRKGENGAAAIEFAIILPVVVLLLIGIIEFSILLYDKQMITNASREGARAGIVYVDTCPRLTEAQIAAVVNTYAQNNLLSFGTALPTTVTVPNDGGGGTCDLISGQPLTVTVTYPYNFLVLPNFVGGLSNIFTLRAETVMRYE